MAPVPDSATTSWFVRLDLYQLFPQLRERRTRLGLAWTAAVLTTIAASLIAWLNCRDADTEHPRRRDGNWGHVNVDFSGQYLLAAMFVHGEGRHLYDRRYQEPLLEKAYTRDGEKPNQETHDPQVILGWVMHSDDKDSSLSGPIYPPVQGLLFAPLGLLPPQAAYRAMMAFNLALTFLAAWLIERLTRGGVWMPVAVVVLFLYPGHAGGFGLGQNPIVTVTLLLLGWQLLCVDRPWMGGLVWGLLAFKPVWAVAFLLVPLLTRRWRFAAGMALCGGGLVLATLPFTGLQPWFDWLKLGNIGSKGYADFRNWIFLSRDLIGLPRRWMLEYEGLFVDKSRSRYGPWPDVLGVMLWLSVPLTTVVVAWRKYRAPAPLDGPGAAFVLLGAFFSCYHFMYYDVLLTLLPVALLFTRPLSYWEQLVARPRWPPMPLVAVVVMLVALPLSALIDTLRTGQNWTPLYPPWDEFALLALWAWCGWQSWQGVEKQSVSLPRVVHG